jgi:alcohol dehydrogenase class IV
VGTRFDIATAADVRFGAGRAGELPAAVAAWKVSRLLVVTGSDPARAEPVRGALSEAGVSSVIFTVPGEPTVDLVREGLARLDAVRADGVLGFGGGSALDAAKALAVLAGTGADPLDHLEVVGAGHPVTGPGVPCLAIPTTAGTGSEVTRNSVIAAGDVKASLRSPLMLPKVAIVDPDLLTGLPAAVIASSGMDALSQLIEPFLSCRANPFTDALARDGIRRSARSLRPAWDGALARDASVREDLALASLFGGLALANSGLGAVHGFAAAAGARFAAPHGAVCAALLAATVAANHSALRRRAPQHPALARVDEVAALLTGEPSARAADAVMWLDTARAAMSVPGLSHYGVTEADIPRLVDAASRASSMRANPIELTSAELAEIVARSL